MSNPWIGEAKETITRTKHLLSNLSIVVRTNQYSLFKQRAKPTKRSKVLDVGVSADETLKDSNIFERLFPYPQNLTAATIEDPKEFKKLYTNIKTIKIIPHKMLPFKDKSFDIVTAWATLEHVGTYSDQEFFINELIRVGKKIFLTTPYRGCIYEPHSGLFFLHWLPLSLFRKICKISNRSFWSKEKNLNPLYVSDILNMNLISKAKVEVYRMFGILPSHLIIYN